MWDDLVSAYEEKLDVLEEARGTFARALADLMEETGRQLDAVSRSSVVDGGRCVVGQPLKEPDEQAVFADTFRYYVPFSDESGTIVLRMGVWVASCFGGPVSTMRLVLELASLPGGLPLPEWTSRCVGQIPDAAPGVSFSTADFPDVSSDGLAMRVVSIDLAERASREAASDVARAAEGLVAQLEPLVEFLRDAALPMTRAEQALLLYRPMLEARASEVAAEVYPSKGGLGDYQGGKYLQVGKYWLCTAPESGGLLVECPKVNEPLVHTLAQRLGRAVSRRVQIGCVLLTEDELRDPEHDVAAAIAMAFDVWFEAREANTAGAEVGLSADQTE